MAQGDLVAVVTVATRPDPRAPGKTYTTSWLDMWRFVDGKADEHWDSATIMTPARSKRGGDRARVSPRRDPLYAHSPLAR
jgi:predicted SnoaL-like aldol condensation-catalyzing enzyme